MKKLASLLQNPFPSYRNHMVYEGNDHLSICATGKNSNPGNPINHIVFTNLMNI